MNLSTDFITGEGKSEKKDDRKMCLLYCFHLFFQLTNLRNFRKVISSMSKRSINIWVGQNYAAAEAIPVVCTGTSEIAK